MKLEVTDVYLKRGVRVLSEDGTVLIGEDGSWKGPFTGPTGSIGTDELADSAVTTAKIADSSVTTAKLANASVTAAKVTETEARTATADGTGTGAITVLTGFKKIVTVTSASATNQISLPGISASTIGQEILLIIGANGCELITPASSNNTINGTDADGTNQLDLAANSAVHCVQIDASSWIVSTLTTPAPDND